MASIEQKMKDFQSESYEEKLKIAMDIITNLKDRGNKQAQQIYGQISEMDPVPVTVLEAIYGDFCRSVERINQDKVQKEVCQLDKMKEDMQNLGQQEERERALENLEELLEKIEDDPDEILLDRYWID